MKPLLIFAAVFLTITPAQAGKHRTDIYREITRTNEKSLRVHISGSFETIFINKGASDKVVTISKKSNDRSTSTVYVDYTISNGIGDMEIDLDRNGSKGEDIRRNAPVAKATFTNGDEGDWYITFSEDLPIDFDLEFDVGKADVNLSGLQITKFNLETGASKVTVRSNIPNTKVIDDVTIEAGLGRFTSDHLGNLNFKKLSFEGGIGSYKLDLTGALRKDAEINAEIGMGSMTIILPSGTPVKMNCEDNWFNSCNFPRFVDRGEGEYSTENIQSYPNHLKINVECGVGSVSVKWRE